MSIYGVSVLSNSFTKEMFVKNHTGNLISTTAATQQSSCDILNNKGWENITYALAMSFILIASVLGNSVVILATLISKSMRKRVTIYFIVSLACSDLFNAVFMVPFFISEKFHNNEFCHGVGVCYLKSYVDVLCNVASIINLFLIAIDRFVAIQFPFSYHTLLSRARARILTLGVWVLSGIWALVGFFDWSTQNLTSKPFSVLVSYYCMNLNYYFYAASYFGLYLIPLIIMSVTYCIILRIALSQIRKIESYSIEPKSNNNSNNAMSKEACKRKLQKNKRDRKRYQELKATKSVAIVYFAFLLCWFPNCVINFIIMFDSTYFPSLKKTNVLLFDIIYYGVIQFLPMINTMINPIIYSFANKTFRKAFKLLFKNVIEKFETQSDVTSSSRRNTRSCTIDSTTLQQTPRSSRSQSFIKEGIIVLDRIPIENSNGEIHG